MKLFVSDFNYQACQAVKTFTPEKWPDVTLMYGPPGTGKSTLLKLMHLRTVRSRAGSMLVNARTFAREYAWAAQEGSLNQFRERYRSIPYLFLDDIQWLVGKAKTIEELLHTFEHRMEYESKLFLTLESQRPELDFLGEKLASRFMSGLTLPLYSPGPEELREFIGGNLAHRLALVEQAVVSSLAERVANLTEAKKLMREFSTFIDRTDASFTLESFQGFWQGREEWHQSRPVPENVIRVTAEVTGISRGDILGTRRIPNLVEARHLAMYAIKETCGSTYAEIGRLFGKEHGAVIQACRIMTTKLEANEGLRERLMTIRAAFGNFSPDKG